MKQTRLSCSAAELEDPGRDLALEKQNGTITEVQEDVRFHERFTAAWLDP